MLPHPIFTGSVLVLQSVGTIVGIHPYGIGYSQCLTIYDLYISTYRRALVILRRGAAGETADRIGALIERRVVRKASAFGIDRRHERITGAVHTCQNIIQSHK